MQVSLVIFVMFLYILFIYKVMKEEGIYEGCIEQIYGLFIQCLYGNILMLDEVNCYCMDGKEINDVI